MISEYMKTDHRNEWVINEEKRLGSGTNGVIFKARRAGERGKKHDYAAKRGIDGVDEYIAAIYAGALGFGPVVHAAWKAPYTTINCKKPWGGGVDSRDYMIMDRLYGRTLGQYLNDSGLRNIIYAPAAVLRAIWRLRHDMNRAHFYNWDWNEDNIMLVFDEDNDKSGVRAYRIDFGIVKIDFGVERLDPDDADLGLDDEFDVPQLERIPGYDETLRRKILGEGDSESDEESDT